MEARPLNDVFRVAPQGQNNKALQHSGYVTLANAVIEQAWHDAKKNTLKADSDAARKWLMNESVMLSLWCAVAGVRSSVIRAKAKEEFGA